MKDKTPIEPTEEQIRTAIKEENNR